MTSRDILVLEPAMDAAIQQPTTPMRMVKTKTRGARPRLVRRRWSLCSARPRKRLTMATKSATIASTNGVIHSSSTDRQTLRSERPGGT